MKFRQTAAATLIKDIRAFADEIESNEWTEEARAETAAEFNKWMDRLVNQDAFGTEGQCDPRGDHRE